jgi:Inner membrane component of T3SS, cytoplasmic domain
VALDRELVIGTAPDADVVLADTCAAPRHARLRAAPEVRSNERCMLVEDLASSNGTFVNGQPVGEPTWLLPGDELLVGTTVLTLRGGEGTLAPGLGPGQLSLPRGVSPPPRLAAAEFPGIEALVRLLDVNVKRRVHIAPAALLALVVVIVTAYMMMR